MHNSEVCGLTLDIIEQSYDMQRKPIIDYVNFLLKLLNDVHYDDMTIFEVVVDLCNQYITVSKQSQ